MAHVAIAERPARHRTDIDGLRGLAVSLVVLYHLNLPGLGGGFIGVDVFFVISGFLIGGILQRELEAGTFSFAGFYERRIRRIAPALLAVLAGTTLLAYKHLYPPELLDYGHTVVAALFSVSNFFFLSKDNYFNVQAPLRPLLHTWSLGVEEQFYLIFPLLLYAVHRWLPSRRRVVLFSLTAISLAAAIVEVHRTPLVTMLGTAFFSSPFRAWELLLGTLLYDIPLPRSGPQRQALTLLGLLLVLLPAIIYSGTTWFPGIAALPPCLGAAMVLQAGRAGPSWIASALSWRPLAFIGLISYSLYLIHWPLIVLQNESQFLVNANHHPHLVVPVLLVASLVAATFSWLLIETPFRRGPLRPARPSLYALTGTAFALVMAAGLDISHYNGWKMPGIPYTDESARYATFNIPLPPGPMGPGTCFVQIDQLALFTPSTCLTIDPTRQNWVLFGDSHALALYAGLHTAFPEANISLATMVGCRPMLHGLGLWSPKDCHDFNTLVLEDFVLHHHVDRVLFALRWLDSSEPDLTDTIAFLRAHGVAVTVFGPAVEFDVPLPRLISIAAHQYDPVVYSNHRAFEQEALDRHFAELARTTWHTPYISAYDDLCTPHPAAPDPSWQVRTATGCPVFGAPGIPLLWDGHHFTIDGSILFAKAIRARHQLP